MESAKKETNYSYEAKEEIDNKNIKNEIKDNSLSIINNIRKFNLKKKKENFISIEEVLNEYDSNNLEFLDKNKDSPKYKYIEEYIIKYGNVTPEKAISNYTKKLFDIINSIQKSNKKVKLPILPYEKHLTDEEFLNLLQECVLYANYHLSHNTLNKMKKEMMKNSVFIQNFFLNGQVLKDLYENLLLSILTSDRMNERNDNLEILNRVKFSSYTPLIELNFGNNKINNDELISTFCSDVYLENYYKTLNIFIPDLEKYVKNKDDLKHYIENYFQKHFIYFCDLPERLMALTIHTGNMYLKAKYLFELFNQDLNDYKLIIREKIILNCGHQIMHCLMREVYPAMTKNFLIKSKNKEANKKNQTLSFQDKFISEFHTLDMNESGNVFDFFFFDKFYFDDLYDEEASLFFDIKNLKPNQYYKKLISIIFGEKNKIIESSSVNKFKKSAKEYRYCCSGNRPRLVKIDEEEYSKNAFNLNEIDKNDNIDN